MEIFQANHQLSLSLANRDNSSMEYRATINSLTNEDSKKAFTASVSADILNKIKDFKLSFIAKNTNLNGFRPGKAPLNLIWKQHKTELTNEIVNEVINNITQTIVNKLDTDLVTSPKIDLKHFSLEKGLDFELSLIPMPKFDLPDLKNISINKPVYEITENDIKERAKLLLANHKNYTKAEAKHTAKLGDRVVIDFEGRIDGVAFAGGVAKKHILELGSKSFIEGFEDQLLKHKAGDEILVKVTFPENYHEKKFAGKPAEFAVIIHEIQQAVSFSNEEELAKSMGFKSAEELNNRIKESLDKECASKSLVKIKTDLFDKLDSCCNFHLPQVMVDEEFAQLWKTVETMLKNKDAEVDKPEAELREEYLKLAKRRVKLGMLLAQMAKQYNVQIEQNDLVEAIRAQAMANPAASQAIVKYYTENPKAVESLKGPILEEKVVKYLLSEIKNIETPAKVKDLLTVSI